MADTTSSSPAAGCAEKLKIYVKTRKGFILAGEILLSFIILICYAASYSGGYTAAAICEMVFAIIFFVVFMMELDKQFAMVNWLWSDLFRAAVGAVVYFITSLVCVTSRYADGAGIAGGVFGLIATVLFAYDTYTIFLQIKSGSQHTAASTDDRV
ncbi:proteolipid protein 2b [Mugil cephalus]|uniref:proteolipid protein 2b n=1 Tax=Mugil cephalus TaxID=48193 RepID=UPI001FB63B37|nr:proteolipid protein 2b [Mugil cephalus]